MKVWTYTIICIVMVLMFKFTFNLSSPIDPFLGFMGINFNNTAINPLTNGTYTNITSVQVSNSNFYDYLFDNLSGFLAALATVGIAIGLLASGRQDIAIKASFASAVLFVFIGQLIFVVQYALINNFEIWMISLLGLIFIPLTAGYIFALVEYVFGTD